ncbi:MAG: ethylbenzene dehydrogenase, partial [Gammaproteobacteria bacterium]
MKVTRIDASDGTLLISTDSVWKDVESRKFPLVPTPLNGNPMIKKISPFIEKSTDHGIINEVTASASHNGNILAVRLSWVG